MGKLKDENRAPSPRRRPRIGVAVTLAVLVLAFVPAGASGAIRFVDFETGDDQGGANVCLVQALPCQLIANAVAAAGTADEIRVDDDTYTESGLPVGEGTTLQAVNFVPGDSGATIIDPGTSASAVISTVVGQAAIVSGFTIRNDSARLIQVNGPATISGNTFDEDNIGAPTPHVLITSFGGEAVVSDNVFDKAPGPGGTAIRTLSTGSPTISGNQISGYNGGIDLRAGTPRVVGNDISEQTGNGSCDPCAGISIFDTQATLIGNTLHDPVAANGSAIGLTELGGGVATSATLERNVVTGGARGIDLFQSGGAATLTLSGDLISGYTDSAIDTTNGTVSATNVTTASAIPGVTGDLDLSNTVLTLDSSIIGAGGIVNAALSNCTITFSRGPATGTPGDPTDCNDFQTTADPQFVSGSDLHLSQGSPMLDAGNPAAPPFNSTDFDGDPRALSATCAGPVAGRRDIGADELVPGVPASCNPTPPGPPAAKAKCKNKGKKTRSKATGLAKKTKKKCKRKKPKR